MALVYPDGNKVGYGYDALGRMTSVTGLDGSVTRYEYDALGRRTLTAGGSLTTEYEYDEVGSVVRMATSGDTNVELLYGYDLNGMLTRETRRENGADTVSEYAYTRSNYRFTYCWRICCVTYLGDWRKEMKKLFDSYGIEVFEDENRYFVRYDEGESVGKMCMMEISEKDALLLQNGEDSAYRVIIKYQNKKG